jgi:hypothetical protein
VIALNASLRTGKEKGKHTRFPPVDREYKYLGEGTLDHGSNPKGILLESLFAGERGGQHHVRVGAHSIGNVLFAIVAILANWATTYFYMMGGAATRRPG